MEQELFCAHGSSCSGLLFESILCPAELGRECFCVYDQLNVNVLGPSILKGCYMNIISKMPTMW